MNWIYGELTTSRLFGTFLFTWNKVGALITFWEDNWYMKTIATLITLLASSRICDLCTINMWKHSLIQNIVHGIILSTV
jgi:hypothetical protein